MKRKKVERLAKPPLPLVRTLETNVSASNLLQILYTTGTLKDSDDILSVSFKNSVVGVDIKNNPLTVIPITIKYKANGTNR